MTLNENIQELSFAEVIGDRFGRYSKYIIQDRALPDIRDGLKPVQRRILYAMYQDRNTADHAYRKSAKTVGNVIGNYHPHGDTSVYDAMVRMSQGWKNRAPLIDMHGNNGSMDGDPAAAMRYTEARLSPIAQELLKDLNFNTVDYGLNFDDTLEEPLVLPARFPNLLINGATGISAGYATEIPPHNLGEVCDALIYMLTHKHYDLNKILTFIQGPDFPTGAIIQGRKEIKKAYEKGRGRIVMKAVTQTEKLKGGRSQIIVTELPFEENKSKLIQKLDDIRLQRKIEGIAEVRDESDINGVRIVIELRRDIDSEGVLNYLLKNTELVSNYHFNMIAIDERRPKQVGLLDILEAYIAFQREVITRRTQFQLNNDQKRLHIVEGLIRVMSILDEVIQTIRSSDNKSNAKENLVEKYDFSFEQAEAIVSLQLYRLTNTDIVALENEKLELNERIMIYQSILSNPEVLNKELIKQLKEIKKTYASPRLTKIENEIEQIEVETTIIVPEEQVIVSVTNEGYFKRTSLRSYSSSNPTDIGMREFDYPIYIEEMNTHDVIIAITNKGNYIHIPVHELPDIRWKETGIHFSQDYKFLDGEQVIAIFKGADTIDEEVIDTDSHLVLITKDGMIKQVALSDLTTYRSYKTRTSMAMKLKDENDEVVFVTKINSKEDYYVVLFTYLGYALRYNLNEVSTYGPRAQGVIGINLRDKDYVASAIVSHNSDSIQEGVLLTQRGNVKRFRLETVSESKRASRGTRILTELKNNPHRIVCSTLVNKPEQLIEFQGDAGESLYLNVNKLTLSDRTSNGSIPKGFEILGKNIKMIPYLDLYQNENK